MEQKKYFVGYVTLPTITGVTDTQARKLTHLNLAFAPMKDGITQMTLDERQLNEIARIRKANPKLAILVSTGGGGNVGYGEATSTPQGMERVTESTMEIVKRYDLDGIDCDWEFPTEEQKGQHTELLRVYREKLDALGAENGRKYWLTTAAGTGEWYIACTEFQKSHVYLDFINLMTYDFNYNQKVAGHHTHLFESKAPGAPQVQSVQHSLELMLSEGVPAEKILIGAAFYSHRWDKVADKNHGLYQPSPYVNAYGPSYTEIMLKFERQMGYTKYWDDDAKAPYLFNGETFISYDDPKSVMLKCEYAKEQGLLGVFYWVHSGDAGSVLFDTIYNTLYLEGKEG